MNSPRRLRHRYLETILGELSPVDQLGKIVADRMCIGCGLCESVAGPDVIRMASRSGEMEQPEVVGDLSAGTMDQIIATCPGTRLKGLPEWQIESDSHYDPVWGIWRQLNLSWASDPAVRHAGSTGGVLTALGLYLIESGDVNFIVHASAGHADPTFGKRTISRSAEDVRAAAGSRYGPTATLIDFAQIVKDAAASGETFALIGTPCDVSAARNLARLDERVDRHCRLMLTMVCGGFMSPAGMAASLVGFGVDPSNVTGVRYRGYGCPGPTRIETEDGEIIERDYLDFWGEDDSAWQLPHRCKVCADGIGDAADIAASDTWNGGAPTREGQCDDPGTNAIIARSVRGAELVNAAASAGYLEIGKQVTPRDMDGFQPHQVAKKEAVWSRFVGMRSAGRVVPDVRGLRLKPLARRNSLTGNLTQARGARKRSKSII